MTVAELGLFLQIAILAYLLLVEPFYGKRLYVELVRTVASDPWARTRFYGRILRMEWGLTALALLSLWLRERPPAAIGLGAWRVASPEALAAIVGALIGLVLSVALAGVSAHVRTAMGKQLALLQALLPVTPRERWQFAGVAITAGICEEILFRGFMGMAFSELFPGAPLWVTVAVLAVCFGLAHWYQGWRGVFLTGALGAGLTVLYLITHSLWLAMLLHALIDLRVLGLALVMDRHRPRGAAG